jgi:hypothetical protein
VADVVVKNKSARRRDLAFVNRGRDLGGKKLGELSVRPGLRTRDPEFRIGQNNEHRSGLGFDVNWFANVEESARRFLRDDPRFLDQLDVGLRAAIADRRLVRVHFDDGVINAHGYK